MKITRESSNRPPPTPGRFKERAREAARYAAMSGRSVHRKAVVTRLAPMVCWCHVGLADLTEVVVVAGYDALAEVYEWLISDAKVTPAQFAASFHDATRLLPSNARVLDCSCGTGQLAVGLAGLGMQVVATDASAGMVRRTEQLAEEWGASLRTARADWRELTDHFDDAGFDMVFCVGNSLHHAEGVSGRLASLGSMSRLLRPGGRLVLTSRNWELVRAAGSRLDIRDQLVRRNGRDALVIYRWEIAPHWEQEHHIEIAVAQVNAEGSVLVRSELLSSWPYRYDELRLELQSVGLRVEKSTFDPEAEEYTVVATKE